MHLIMQQDPAANVQKIYRSKEHTEMHHEYAISIHTFLMAFCIHILFLLKKFF